MFKEYINTPIDPIPQEYIDTLRKLDYEPDYSLTCLCIALLKDRIKEYKGICGEYASRNEEIVCVNEFIENHKYCSEIPTLYYYRYVKESDNVIEKLKENGFEVKESIGALIKNKADIKCVAAYHPTDNYAAIFIKSNEIKFYHLCISFISLLFPNLFKDMPLTKDEYSVVYTLGKNDKDAFILKIQESVMPRLYEFRRIMLGNMMKGMHEYKINKAMTDVSNQRNSVEMLAQQYTDAIKYLKDLIVVYEGMKATEKYDDPEEELVEYLAGNKNIHNLSIKRNVLSFSVATLLNNYNADAWATFSDRGYIYDGMYGRGAGPIELLGVFKDTGNRKKLLDNLFSESPDFAIKIAGNYSLNLESCFVSASKTYDYNAADPIYKSYLPNPHLKLFSCLGGYSQRITKALRDRNYIAAIELCCASAGSVDMDETDQTFRPFLGWLLTSREKILHRNDGVDMTPEEALIWLIDKEKE